MTTPIGSTSSLSFIGNEDDTMMAEEAGTSSGLYRAVDPSRGILITDIEDTMTIGSDSTTSSERSSLRKRLQSRRFACRICNKTFLSTKVLRKHEQAHPRKPFVCKYCNASFTRKARLINHMVVKHKSTKPYSSHARPRSYPRQKTLKRQSYSRPGRRGTVTTRAMLARNNTATVNDKEPETANDIMMDQATDTTDDTTTAQETDSSSGESTQVTLARYNPNENSLLRSILMRRDDEESDNKTYLCDVCGSFVTQLKRLQKHLFVHNVLAVKLCQICQKAFLEMSNLRQHHQTHFN